MKELKGTLLVAASSCVIYQSFPDAITTSSTLLVFLLIWLENEFYQVIYGLAWQDDLTLVMHTFIYTFTIKILCFDFPFLLLLIFIPFLRKCISVYSLAVLLLLLFISASERSSCWFGLSEDTIQSCIPKIYIFFSLVIYHWWLTLVDSGVTCDWNFYDTVIPIKNTTLLWSYFFLKKELS